MWTSSLGLRVPSSWWPGQWERGRWGPQTSGVFALQTGDPRGPLLPWQEVGKASQGKDFIGLGLQDGHLVFSYQLGSGEARLVSEDPINDGEWHRVTALR